MMTIMERLKAETREEHVATERRPLVKAMLKGHLAPDAFQWKLWGYRELHRLIWRTLEEAPPGHADACRRLVGMTRPRDAHLSADLVLMLTPIPAALRQWRGVLDSAGPEGPVRALGWLYVMEGSSLGAQVLLEPLTRRYPASLLRYYRGHGEQTRARWATFSSLMNEAVENEDACIEGARACFGAITDLFDAIDGARRTPRTQYPSRNRAALGAR